MSALIVLGALVILGLGLGFDILDVLVGLLDLSQTDIAQSLAVIHPRSKRVSHLQRIFQVRLGDPTVWVT